MKKSSQATHSNRPVQILFVCVGNTCRSQMAEAFANHLGKGKVRAFSAGSHPMGTILPETRVVMREKGISLEGQWSKGLNEVPVKEMDVVVGMGCEVQCPVPVGFKGRVVEWNIPDPYSQDGEYFRGVRDMIERQVESLLREVTAKTGGAPSSRDATPSSQAVDEEAEHDSLNKK